jgi:hypothetical protein
MRTEMIHASLTNAKGHLKEFMSTEEFSMLGTGPAYFHFKMVANIVYGLVDRLEEDLQKESV